MKLAARPSAVTASVSASSCDPVPDVVQPYAAFLFRVTHVITNNMDRPHTDVFPLPIFHCDSAFLQASAVILA